MSSFWHPMADMSSIAGHEFVITDGVGATVTSEDGRTFIDATAALWYCNVGHGRTEIGAAVARQMARLAAYSNFGDYTTEPTRELADRLADMAPMAGAKIFFTSGGSDSVDTAVKLVRRYWHLRGHPGRTHIITRTRSYHGMHLAGTSMAGIPGNREGYGALGPDMSIVEWNDPWALAKEIDDIGAERVAAFFCEPIIGAGGVYLPPEGYLEEVRAICRERGVLFVADEVICGFGRTGAMFGSDRWHLDPDVMLTAKGLTSGYLPMGAVFIAGSIAEPFWSTPGVVWRHGYTYSGHASTAAAALANLDILDREGLVGRVADLQLPLRATLSPLAGHDHVHEVRSGTGLLGAVQIRPEILAEDATFLPRLISAIRDRGVLTRALADGSIQVSPSFVIERAQLQQISDAIDAALTDLGSSRTSAGRLDVDLLPETTRDELRGPSNRDAELLANVPPHHAP